MTFAMILRRWARGWPLITALAMIGGLFGAAVGLTAGHKYTASAQVVVIPVDPRTTDSVLVRMATYAQMATTVAVLEEAAKRSSDPGISRTSPSSLVDQVTAMAPDGTLFVRVTAEAATPRQSQSLAADVAAGLVARIQAERSTASAETSRSETNARILGGVRAAVVDDPMPGESAGASIPLLIVVGSVAGASLGLLISRQAPGRRRREPIGHDRRAQTVVDLRDASTDPVSEIQELGIPRSTK